MIDETTEGVVLETSPYPWLAEQVVPPRPAVIEFLVQMASDGASVVSSTGVSREDLDAKLSITPTEPAYAAFQCLSILTRCMRMSESVMDDGAAVFRTSAWEELVLRFDKLPIEGREFMLSLFDVVESQETDATYTANAAAQKDRLATKVDVRSMKLHRVGTTSVLFRCRGLDSDAGRPLVLKCLHHRFHGVRLLREGTQEMKRKNDQYLRNAGDAGVSLPVPEVVVSRDYYVVTRFVSGRTLSDIMLEGGGKGGKTRASWLAELEQIVPLLSKSIRHFHLAAGEGHGDLTPSNVIVVSTPDEDVESVQLIDFGRNLLASHAISAIRPTDASFVSPSVLSLDPTRSSTSQVDDFYSLGLIIMALSACRHGVWMDGRPAKEGFEEYPYLMSAAASISHRSTLGEVNESDVQDQVELALHLEEGATTRVVYGSNVGRRVFVSTVNVIGAVLRSVGVGDFWGAFRDPHLKGRAKATAKFSAVARLVNAWLLTLALLVSITSMSMAGYGGVFGQWSESGFFASLLNSLGRSGSAAPDARYLEAGFAGLTVALACFVYYEWVFVGVDKELISALRDGGNRRDLRLVAPLIAMWLPLPMVIWASSGSPQLWPAMIGLGYIGIGLNNALIHSLQRDTKQRLERSPIESAWQRVVWWGSPRWCSGPGARCPPSVSFRCSCTYRCGLDSRKTGPSMRCLFVSPTWCWWSSRCGGREKFGRLL